MFRCGRTFARLPRRGFAPANAREGLAIAREGLANAREGFLATTRLLELGLPYTTLLRVSPSTLVCCFSVVTNSSIADRSVAIRLRARDKHI